MENTLKINDNNIEINDSILTFNEPKLSVRDKVVTLVTSFYGAGFELDFTDFMGTEFIPSLLFWDGKLKKVVLMPTYRKLRETISTNNRDRFAGYEKEFNEVISRLTERYGEPKVDVYSGGKQNTVKTYLYHTKNILIEANRLVDESDYRIVAVPLFGKEGLFEERTEEGVEEESKED